MNYHRPKSNARLTKQEKIQLMGDYVEFYRKQHAADPTTLNRKIPREAFTEITDAIGSLLLDKTAKLASAHGRVSGFLKDNPLPPSLHNLLPPETRAFCLALNALKQWVSAEQAAMDRLILGGTARETCREATPNCLVTSQPLDRKTLNLHHPVRDGRPPLPLSKEGHDKVERQHSHAKDDQENCLPEDELLLAILKNLKRQGNRSWVMLRKGCLDLIGHDVHHSTVNVGATSKTFARKASDATGLNYEQLLQWLDRKGWG